MAMITYEAYYDTDGRRVWLGWFHFSDGTTAKALVTNNSIDFAARSRLTSSTVESRKAIFQHLLTQETTK